MWHSVKSSDEESLSSFWDYVGLPRSLGPLTLLLVSLSRPPDFGMESPGVANRGDNYKSSKALRIRLGLPSFWVLCLLCMALCPIRHGDPRMGPSCLLSPIEPRAWLIAQVTENSLLPSLNRGILHHFLKEVFVKPLPPSTICLPPGRGFTEAGEHL